MSGAYGTREEMNKCVRNMVLNSEWKKNLSRWDDDNIKWNYRKVGRVCVGRIHL